MILLAAFGAALAGSPAAPPVPEGARVIRSEEMEGASRVIYAPDSAPSDLAPAISFIDSPTHYCYQPDPAQNVCYINWYYQSVDAVSPNYMITMTTVIADRLRASYHGFFQQSMYVSYAMQSPGFKVPCGAPGASGDPNLGLAYSWTMRARSSDGLGSANYGTTYCPFYQP